MSHEANRAFFWRVADRTQAEDVLAKLKLGNPAVSQEEIIKALGFTILALNQAIPLLVEFEANVEAVGIDALRNEDEYDPTSWPDMAETYDKVKAFLDKGC